MKGKLRAYNDTPLMLCVLGVLGVVMKPHSAAPWWGIGLAALTALMVYVGVSYYREYGSPFGSPEVVR